MKKLVAFLIAVIMIIGTMPGLMVMAEDASPKETTENVVEKDTEEMSPVEEKTSAASSADEDVAMQEEKTPVIPEGEIKQQPETEAVQPQADEETTSAPKATNNDKKDEKQETVIPADETKPAVKTETKALTAPVRTLAEATEIDAVSLTVTPPEAGMHSTNAKAAISTSTPGLSVAHAYWHELKGYTSADPAEIDFVEGNSYYVVVCLDVVDGYTLKKGAGKPSLDIDACDYAFGGDTSVSGGTLDSAAFRSTERYGSEKLYVWAKATATAGSAQTVNMRVWTEGHGKVLVNDTDYDTEFQGTWYEGTEVQAKAVPDAGYKLERWWIQKSPGPNARIYDTAITLVAGTDLVAEALFALETASVTITPPAAGTTAATDPQITLPDGAGYSLDTLPWGGQAAYWTTADSLLTSYPETLDESTVFEPGQTYYAYVRLADGADSFAATAGGSSFDTDLNVTGGTKAAQGNFAAWSEERGNYMGIMAIIAVTIPEETPSYDLTFEFQNVGTSASLADLVSSITVNGEEWSLPASGMKVTKPVPVGASVTAVAKATAGAAFFGASSEYIPDFEGQPSNDLSTYTFTFTMPESGTIGITPIVKVLTSKVFVVTYDANGGTTGPAWQDSHALPDFMAELMKSWDVGDADLVDGYSGEVIVEAPAGANFAGLEITDKNGTHTGVPGTTITDLDFSEGATIKYLWEMPPTLTLHWSSVDGEDLLDPIEIEYTPGMTLAEALATKSWNMNTEVFAKDGYVDYGFRTPEPLGEYADYDEIHADKFKGDYVLGEDSVDIYYLMLKEIDKVEFSIEPPVCGTETSVPEGTDIWATQTNPPEVSAPDGVPYGFPDGEGLPAIWADFTTGDEFIGTFKGGETYPVGADLVADFGYVFANNVDVSVENSESAVAHEIIEDRLFAAAKIKAVHDPAEPVEENVVEPTCTEPGSHDEVVYCKHCEEKISSDTVEDSALGHDWGNWVETKAPTCTEPGEEQRECSRCDEEETREVAALGHDWDEGTVTTEPTCTDKGVKTFTCKRDVTHTKTESVDALGHDWGAWEVVEEPTETEDGLEQRTCGRCGEIETRAIPHLVVEYRNTEGDGSVWEKGSKEALTFIFKRNINDEKTFSHFTGIQVDGKDVAETNYKATSGSVVVTLKPAYLETLEVGKHTISALFDDGNKASAKFTVKEKEGAPSKKDTEKDKSNNNKAKDQTSAKKGTTAPKTGDTSDTLLWLVVMSGSLLFAFGVAGVRRRYAHIKRK